MNKYISKFISFCKEEEGASGIEYAIVAAMVAVVIITFGTGIGDGITSIFNKVVTGLGS